MYKINKKNPRKIVDEHFSSVSGNPKFGYCPWCGAAMAYTEKDVCDCLCCNSPVDWVPEQKEK